VRFDQDLRQAKTDADWWKCGCEEMVLGNAMSDIETELARMWGRRARSWSRRGGTRALEVGLLHGGRTLENGLQSSGLQKSGVVGLLGPLVSCSTALRV